MTVSEAAILVPPAEQPKPPAGAFRALGATFAGGVLAVRVQGGPAVTVPPGAAVLVNGFPVEPADVPGWFAAHAAETARAEAERRQAAAAGKRGPRVDPVTLTLADSGAGPVARFDQTSA